MMVENKKIGLLPIAMDHGIHKNPLMPKIMAGTDTSNSRFCDPRSYIKSDISVTQCIHDCRSHTLAGYSCSKAGNRRLTASVSTRPKDEKKTNARSAHARFFPVQLSGSRVELEGIGRRSIFPSADIRKTLPERSRDSCLDIDSGMLYIFQSALPRPAQEAVDDK